MRKLIRQLLVLFFIGYLAYTFNSTYYKGPEQELEHIIIEYANKGDVTGVEISLDQERIIHANNIPMRDSIFRMVRGGVEEISFGKTVYNEDKTVAMVDCTIVRHGDDGPVTNRNYFFMCYDRGIGWSIYDIIGHSNMEQMRDEYEEQFGEDTWGDAWDDTWDDTWDYPGDDSSDDARDEPWGGSMSDDAGVTVLPDDEQAYESGNDMISSLTETQILMAALDYHNSHNPGSASMVRLDDTDGNIWCIQIYEDMGDHISTFDWYYIDRTTLRGNNLFGEEIDLSSFMFE
ncbi:MAG: hypothetical protein K5871_00380 [Lachnospiraceae bacterium]|nr:hypothetical protein [Lachnospiraceae bacterium]